MVIFQYQLGLCPNFKTFALILRFSCILQGLVIGQEVCGNNSDYELKAQYYVEEETKILIEKDRQLYAPLLNIILCAMNSQLFMANLSY